MSGSRAFGLLQQWRLPSSKLPREGRQRKSYRLPSGFMSRITVRTSSSISSPGLEDKEPTRSHSGNGNGIVVWCFDVYLNHFKLFGRAEPINAFQQDGSAPLTPGKHNLDGVRIRVEPLRKHITTGAFQQLPMVMPSVDILSSAQRKARNVSPTKGIQNIAKRERNRGAKQLDALMKELAVPLRKYTETFPNKRYLHPYERSLIELTFGEGNYEEMLGRVDTLRKKLVSVGKQQASLCAQSTSKREAEERLREGCKQLEEVFQHGRTAIDDLLNVAKTLRAMPVVDPQTPTLCLVGAPNVGKSSLVRILSTGKPEVCNYPFTTRGILMGHIILNYERFQVTDTPGLLTRHDDERNNIERLTLAVLSFLPTAVLYVHDLSGECGTSPDDQFITYKEIRERFNDHLWVDVVSKCDILQKFPLSSFPNDIDEDEDEVGRYKRLGPDGAIWVSVKSEQGVNELKARVHDLLLSQMTRLRSQQSSVKLSDGEAV